MLASSVLSDSELLLLSSLGERVGNEVWINPQEQGLHPSNACLGQQQLPEGCQHLVGCAPHTGSWGRSLLISQHFTPSLWELGLGKQVSPSLTPPPTGPGGFLDKPQCVPTRLLLPPRTHPRAVFAA